MKRYWQVVNCKKSSTRRFWILFERNGSDSVFHFWKYSSQDQEEFTPRTSITISNYSGNLPRNVYICTHITRAPSPIYLDKVESRDEGSLFPCKASSRQKNARLRIPPSMPLANYSSLPFSTSVDTRCDPRWIAHSSRFLDGIGNNDSQSYDLWKKDWLDKGSSEIGVVSGSSSIFTCFFEN